MARPGIEPRTSDLRVRCPTDCATRPGLWLINLILKCGDIHANPGPGSVSTTSESSSVDSFQYLSNNLSIFHLNIQSLLPKVDISRGEAVVYELLVLSESWLKPNISNEAMSQKILPPSRRERRNRVGGGVVIYVRDTLRDQCKRRYDLETSYCSYARPAQPDSIR